MTWIIFFLIAGLPDGYIFSVPSCRITLNCKGDTICVPLQTEFLIKEYPYEEGYLKVIDTKNLPDINIFCGYLVDRPFLIGGKYKLLDSLNMNGVSVRRGVVKSKPNLYWREDTYKTFSVYYTHAKVDELDKVNGILDGVRLLCSRKN